ncbi:uncharacterized protein LOC115231102 [Argonauta hians]
MLTSFQLLLMLFQSVLVFCIGVSATGAVVHLPYSVQHLTKANSKRSDSGSNIPYKEDVPCFGLHMLEGLQERFHRFFDANRDGKATKKEVAAYLRKFDPKISQSFVDEFVEVRDINLNGVIDLIPDYIMTMSEHETRLYILRDWFQLEDTNNDDIITKEDIEKIGVRLGLSDREIRDSLSYYALADENGDGKVTWTEYELFHKL